MKYAKYELIMKRAKVHDSRFDYKITNCEDVYKFATKIMRLHEKAEEYFCVITCNTKLEISGYYEVSHGNIDSSPIHPRDVLKPAISLNAACIACLHNHPSGIADPSTQDIQVTKRLKDASEIIGIPMIDHVIIGYGEYTSMKSEGYL